jgi:hypothetical protein
VVYLIALGLKMFYYYPVGVAACSSATLLSNFFFFDMFIKSGESFLASGLTLLYSDFFLRLIKSGVSSYYFLLGCFRSSGFYYAWILYFYRRLLSHCPYMKRPLLDTLF